LLSASDFCCETTAAAVNSTWYTFCNAPSPSPSVPLSVSPLPLLLRLVTPLWLARPLPSSRSPLAPLILLLLLLLCCCCCCCYCSCPAYAPAGGGPTQSCACADNGVIGKGLGWELGWAAQRGQWTRLISLHRWLGQAAHVEQTPLMAETLGYDCMKRGEAHGFVPPISDDHPSGAGCWGDPGNGVQIGWFLWGEGLARFAAGLPVVVV
jgi:hypothetical protein